MTVVAEALRFKPNSLSAPSGATLTVTFDNRDAGVFHDIVFYDPSGARVAGTEIAEGPNVMPVTFTPAGPGQYAFRCTVHAAQMTGVLTVQ